MNHRLKENGTSDARLMMRVAFFLGSISTLEMMYGRGLPDAGTYEDDVLGICDAAAPRCSLSFARESILPRLSEVTRPIVDGWYSRLSLAS